VRLDEPAVLRGRRVTLRPYRSEEVDLVEAGFRVKDAARWLPLGPPPRSELRRRVEAGGRFVDGRIDLALEAEGRLVGEVDARRPRWCLPPGVFELGVSVFDPADRGRGFGSEAVALLTEHLFESGEAHRVELTTDVDNAAMRTAAERLGFVAEGVLRSFMPAHRGRRDYALYAMTRKDWRKNRTRWTRTD
jgi:RimJ/RimL family protein N-acetyltransferase